jgi:hypothetical protein
MPIPLIVWGGAALGGLYLGSRALDEAGDAADSATRLVKWSVAAGGVYVSFKALEAAGVFK